MNRLFNNQVACPSSPAGNDTATWPQAFREVIVKENSSS